MSDEKFEISQKKSLMGHKLSVWSKKWFSYDMAPISELGTIRSITETEGKGIIDVHESKVASNYGAILKLLQTMIRMDIPDKIVRWWSVKMCNFGSLKFRHDAIPVSLNEVLEDKESYTKSGVPEGLKSERVILESMDLPYNIFNSPNTFEMLLSTWRRSHSVNTTPTSIKYYPKGTTLHLKAFHDYAIHDDSNIPYHLKNLMLPENESQQDYSSRQFINCSGSFDGPVNTTFTYIDIVSLAHALVERDKQAWRMISI